MAIWDDYLNSQYSGAAADAAKSAAIGQKAPPITTSGNKAWRDAQNPEPQPEPSIPPAIPPIKPTPQPYQPTQLPAVNQALQPNRNTAFATNAPINTIAQNLAAQIPIGGFGLGLGYGSQQMNIGDFMNPSTQQQPTLSGYRWSKGTGGLTGGNNAQANYFFNDGTAFAGPANSQYDLPLLGGTIDQQPGLTTQKTQYTLPGVNADVRALSDPSVGALDNAQRSTNVYGQQVINPVGGGQIISGRGPTAGFLGNARSINKDTGAQMINTPSGGTIKSGPSRRQPYKMTPGDTYSLGGWY